MKKHCYYKHRKKKCWRMMCTHDALFTFLTAPSYCLPWTGPYYSTISDIPGLLKTMHVTSQAGVRKPCGNDWDKNKQQLIMRKYLLLSYIMSHTNRQLFELYTSKRGWKPHQNHWNSSSSNMLSKKTKIESYKGPFCWVSRGLKLWKVPAAGCLSTCVFCSQ